MMKTFSLAEVCEILGCVSERWVVKRVRNGTFPARKVNRDIRFTEDDVRAVLNACAYQPDAPEVDTFIPQLSERSRRAS